MPVKIITTGIKLSITFGSLSESVSEMKQRRRDGKKTGPQITQITPIEKTQATQS
jgi:hypothetical protein